MSNSMWRYSQSASQDAIDILRMVDADIGLAEARKFWISCDKKDLVAIERDWANSIADFLALAPSRRAAYLRKQPFYQDKGLRIAYLVLCALAAFRASAFLDLRDRYLHALTPGAAYRRVTAGVATLLTAAGDLYDLSWPTVSHCDTGLYDGSDEDEDGNDLGEDEENTDE